SIGFLLGLLSGFELTLFRQIHSTNINNGIMTGNAKNLMNNFYKTIYKHDQKAKQDFLALFFGLMIFMIGIACGTLIIYIGPTWNIWAAFALTLLFYLWLLFKKHKPET